MLHFLELANPAVLKSLGLGIFYLGPETIMPLASILAAVVGISLIFWRFIVNFIKKLFKVGGSSQESVDELIDPDAEGHPKDIE